MSSPDFFFLFSCHFSKAKKKDSPKKVNAKYGEDVYAEASTDAYTAAAIEHLFVGGKDAHTEASLSLLLSLL